MVIIIKNLCYLNKIYTILAKKTAQLILVVLGVITE